MKTDNPEIDDSSAEWIIGSDEAGYGCLAGSLIVVGVCVERTWQDPKVTDSKALKSSARDAIVRQYRSTVRWKGVVVPPGDIDRLGAWRCLRQAHLVVHECLESELLTQWPKATYLHIVDGLSNAHLPPKYIPLKKADFLVPAVSLASCFAKVSQCILMDQAHQKYPGYGFEQHRGYDTVQHRRALHELGVCPLHRRSYSTIKRLLAPKLDEIMDLNGSE